MLCSINYSINSKVYFPYKMDGKIFNWEAFETVFINMSNKDLLEILSNN